MRLYARTRDLLLVQKTLGHASIETTLIYAKALDEVPDDCLVKIADDPAEPLFARETVESQQQPRQLNFLDPSRQLRLYRGA